MIRYKAVTLDEAKKNGYPEAYGGQFDDDWIDDYLLFVYKFVDGVAVEQIASDGGEPEDQTLSRDWSWVVPELNKAYLEGVNSWRE